MDGKTANQNFIISSGMATLLAVLMKIVTFRMPESLLGIGTLGNIKAYIMIIAVWAGSAYILNVVLNKFVAHEIPTPAKCIIALISIVVGMFMCVNRSLTCSYQKGNAKR